MTQSSEPVVLLDISERIATITLNRPGARNALSSELLRLLNETMKAADANDEHQREAGECRDTAGDVGHHHQLRLCRARIFELRLGWDASVAERMPHGVAEIEGTPPAVPALACESSGKLAREWKQRLFQPLHLFAAGMHELHVFG